MAVRKSRQPEARRRHRNEQIGRYREMKGWMKRRIERSRERCERAEKRNRPQMHTDERGSNQLVRESRTRAALELVGRVEKLA